MPPEISDEAIRLDGHVLADAEAHVSGEDREMRLRFEAPDLDAAPSVEHVRGVLQRWIDARAVGGPGFVYAVRIQDGALAGGCEIRRTGAAQADVSYWIYPAFRRRGYGARALRLLCAAASAIGVRRIEAHIDADNAASCAAAGSAGFRDAGTVEDDGADGRKVVRRRFVLVPDL